MVTIDEAAERKALRNPPAFPVDHRALMQGMTLRDYFAAKAMQNMLQSRNGVVGTNRYEYQIAIDSYQIADAMLKARNAAQ